VIALLAFLGVLSLPSFMTLIDDPAPGLFTSISQSRRIVCSRASIEEAKKAHPGLLEDTHPRGDFIEREAMLCAEPIVGSEQRNPRDGAILWGLTQTSEQLASQLTEVAGAQQANWLVEVHYPSASVVSKISFAAKSAMLHNGLQVSDRLPILGVGDIEVLSTLPALKAYPLACRRYYSPGRLSEADAVLSLMVLDSRETALHAGACVKGRWTWLR